MASSCSHGFAPLEIHISLGIGNRSSVVGFGFAGKENDLVVCGWSA